MPLRLAALPAPARLAVACFVVLLLGFHVVAQANLWQRDGGGSLPGPREVLLKYHGDPATTPLHRALDLELAPDAPRAMWWYLDPSGAGDMDVVRARRETILRWVEEGAPREGWTEVAPTLAGTATCGQCHGPGGDRSDLPFTTYEEALAVARPAPAMLLGPLLVSAHNHVFAFAVMALLLGLATAGTALPALLKAGLVLAAFAGAAVDVGSWFLTRTWGDPFQHGVILGGALFGLATTLMAVAVLDETATRGRVARLLLRSREAPVVDASAPAPRPPGRGQEAP